METTLSAGGNYMAGIPLVGDSAVATVPGVKGTNEAPNGGWGVEARGETGLVAEGVTGISVTGETFGALVRATGLAGSLNKAAEVMLGQTLANPLPAGQPDPFPVIGVRGTVTKGTGTGVWGEGWGGTQDFYMPGGTGTGVYGSGPVGVWGANSTNTYGFLGGHDHWWNQPVGVYGESANGINSVGVFGWGDPGTPPGDGVHIPDLGGTGVLASGFIGVRGETGKGVGVQGRAFDPAGLAGRFIGNVQIRGTLESGQTNVDGDLHVSGDVFLDNGDIAERFQVDAPASYVPGTVMSIGNDGLLAPCSDPYDRRVVGVISGAGPLRPAVTLRDSDKSSPTAVIALVGTVYCLADASKEPIEVGDLLTTSETPGYAMKASDSTRSFGAIIGKALAPLSEGHGLVPIVVALQ